MNNVVQQLRMYNESIREVYRQSYDLYDEIDIDFEDYVQQYMVYELFLYITEIADQLSDSDPVFDSDYESETE